MDLNIAALIVSAIAMVLAGLSALYARKQAHAAQESADIERARRHDERTPVLDVVLEPLNLDGQRRYQRLVVRLTTPEPLSGIDVEVKDAPGLSLSPNQDGVAAGAPLPIVVGRLRAPTGGVLLTFGGEVAWQMEVDPSARRRPSRARLVFHLVRADESWVVQHDVRVPGGPPHITTASMHR